MPQLIEEIARIRHQANSSPVERIAALNKLFAENDADFLNRYLELRERVVKGDLAALDQGMASVGNILTLRQEVLPTICEPDFLARNFDLCAPFLLEAYNGSKEAEQGYEESRFLHKADAPLWSRDVISRKLVEEFGTTIPLIVNVRTSNGAPQINRTGIRYLAPKWDLSYGTAATYRSQVQSVKVIDEIRSVYELDKGRADAILAENLAKNNIDGSLPWIGGYITKNDIRTAELLLGARLLDDSRTLFSLPLEDRELERVLGVMTKPWEVLQHSLIQKAVLVSNLLVDSPELEDYGRALLISKHPNRKALQLQRELQDRVKENATAQSSQQVESIEVRPEISIGMGVREALETYTDLTPNEVREQTRHIKACIRRGAGSFTALIQRLKAGVSTASILDDFRGALKRPELEEVVEPESQNEQTTPVAQPSPRIDNEVLVHAKHFRKQLKGFPPPLRRFVEACLIRIKEDGYEGDYEKLHDTDLYMLRIDKGPGIRVYYTKVSPTIWSFITIGTKKDYLEAQSRAAKFLKDGYPSEPYL